MVRAQLTEICGRVIRGKTDGERLKHIYPLASFTLILWKSIPQSERAQSTLPGLRPLHSSGKRSWRILAARRYRPHRLGRELLRRAD